MVVKTVEVEKRLNVWEAPKGLPPCKRSTTYLVPFRYVLRRQEALPKGKEPSSKPVKRKMAGESKYG